MPARSGITALMLAMLATTRLNAQQLVSGARVRGESVNGRFQGRVAWVTPESLAVVQDVDTTVRARSVIRRLDVAAGSQRHPWTGTAIGAGIGAAAGLAVIIAADDNRIPSWKGSRWVWPALSCSGVRRSEASPAHSSRPHAGFECNLRESE